MRLKTLIIYTLMICGVFNPINLLGNNANDSLKFRRIGLDFKLFNFSNFNIGNGYQMQTPSFQLNYFNNKYGLHFGLGKDNNLLSAYSNTALFVKGIYLLNENTLDDILGRIENSHHSNYFLLIGKHFQNKRNIINLGFSFSYFDKISEYYIRDYYWWGSQLKVRGDLANYNAMGIGPYFECYIKVKNRISMSVNYQYNYLFWVKKREKDWEEIEQYNFSAYHFNTISLKFGLLL